MTQLYPGPKDVINQLLFSTASLFGSGTYPQFSVFNFLVFGTDFACLIKESGRRVVCIWVSQLKRSAINHKTTCCSPYHHLIPRYQITCLLFLKDRITSFYTLSSENNSRYCLHWVCYWLARFSHCSVYHSEMILHSPFDPFSKTQFILLNYILHIRLN